MCLTHEEQRLIDEFRKLPASCRDELLTYAASLMRRAGAEAGTASNQCRISEPEQRPEAEKSPLITE
mgnify:CR=1 FL=1